ncbi:MAG TPA: N-acetylmannosamine-6-phosphate 2-epimerase [Candidatus Baltobacteraceae bacterium]|nr:N-acetylmannosamine-6-phosphate 2-epimerase [Candidatus Baltobacteraceae bacterium]
MKTLDRLRGGLIVSVQAWPGSPIDEPGILAAMARSAQRNGAAGVRMQSVENIRAARAQLDLPMIGIIKTEYPGFAPYITPSVKEVQALAACGVEIVAFDATPRPRPDGASVETLVEAIHDAGCVAMADCATVGDALCAQAAGAEMLATTLCGYTEETSGTPLPALALVAELAELDAFVVCEGGVARPERVSDAFDAGADAVVVGSAITNVDWLVREFASRAPKRPPTAQGTR